MGERVLFSDQEGGGALRALDHLDPYRGTTLLDGTTQPGFTENAEDGDLAVEADGDVLFIAQGNLFRFDAQGGTSSVIASGFGQLRALTIAASSGQVQSATGFSAYVAEASGSSSLIREIGGVDAPAGRVADSLGVVPNRGIFRSFFGNIQTLSLIHI